MSEKPQKRLVSKGRYVWSMTSRTILLAFSVLFALIGAYGVLGILFSIAFNVTGMSETDGRDNLFVLFLTAAILFTAGVFFLAYSFWKKERTIERVAPITKRTTSTLPPEESLVRASAVPPSQQQAELLRAAQYGKETPAEELLRATTIGEESAP
jgi:hypothetical protein